MNLTLFLDYTTILVLAGLELATIGCEADTVSRAPRRLHSHMISYDRSEHVYCDLKIAWYNVHKHNNK